MPSDYDKDQGKRGLTVTGDVNFFRKFGDVDVESVLHVIQGLRVSLVTDECDSQSLRTEPSGASHSVQIRVRVLRHVVVEDDVHSFDVHASSEQVSRDEDALVEVFELLIARQSVVVKVTSETLMWMT